MAGNRTFTMIKPDAVRAGNIGNILQMINAAGFRIVAAYPQGSKDIESSTKRVPEYTEKVKALGVEIVDSIPALLEKVEDYPGDLDGLFALIADDPNNSYEKSDFFDRLSLGSRFAYPSTIR